MFLVVYQGQNNREATQTYSAGEQ